MAARDGKMRVHAGTREAPAMASMRLHGVVNHAARARRQRWQALHGVVNRSGNTHDRDFGVHVW